MLVVDASVLFEVVTGGPGAPAMQARLRQDPDHAAPHIVDVEVFGAIRREHLRGLLDRTQSTQAVRSLELWPGDRYGHRPLLGRAWDLRHSVRGSDAMYVALAEALEAILITTDVRLAGSTGPTCRIDALTDVP
ncbi:MAG: type II toxin-antitoxin system VapC family toxin [Actinomycetota bacterium]|nr:type II toxin-antitoxin system VapC family toxin [Actinomycetota bacterium]